MRASLIVNPSAGGGRAGRALPAVRAALERHGIEHHVDQTRTLEHARELTRAAVAAGERADAFGGDGLVGAVAGALQQSNGVLGVLPGAKSTEIRAAYRRRARESHPDLNPLDPASGARMTRLNRAVRILLDPSRRAAYDRAQRRATTPSAQGRSWYERAAGGSEWDVPIAAAGPITVAGRRFSRRVRSSGDVLAMRAAQWLLALERGECLLLAALCIAIIRSGMRFRTSMSIISFSSAGRTSSSFFVGSGGSFFSTLRMAA